MEDGFLSFEGLQKLTNNFRVQWRTWDELKEKGFNEEGLSAAAAAYVDRLPPHLREYAAKRRLALATDGGRQEDRETVEGGKRRKRAGQKAHIDRQLVYCPLCGDGAYLDGEHPCSAQDGKFVPTQSSWSKKKPSKSAK